MVGLGEAAAAVGGLKTAYEMAKGVQALTADVHIKLKTMELMEAILSAQQSALQAQEAQSEMLKRITELEAQIAGHDAWQREKSRYKLEEFPSGAQVYVLRAEAADGEISHRLCPACFQKGEKSILQTVGKHSGGELVQCIPCKNNLTLSPFRPSMPGGRRVVV